MAKIYNTSGSLNELLRKINYYGKINNLQDLLNFKNKISEENRKKILNSFVQRKDIDHFAKIVDNKDIAENDYNLSVSSYVEQEDTREVVNIKELNKEIDQIVKRQQELRSAIDKIVADIEGE